MTDREKIQYWISGLIVGVVFAAYAMIIAVVVKVSSQNE